MIRKISYLKKPMQQMTAKDMAKVLTKTAVKSKEVAMNLAAQGLRGNVTPTFAKKVLGDIFDKSDVIKKEVAEGLLGAFKLPKDSSIGDYFLAVCKKHLK